MENENEQDELTKMLADVEAVETSSEEPSPTVEPTVSPDLDTGGIIISSISQIQKMKGSELDELYAQEGLAHVAWTKLKVGDKKQYLVDHFSTTFTAIETPADPAIAETVDAPVGSETDTVTPKEAAEPAQTVGNNKLLNIAAGIEKLADQSEIEKQIDSLVDDAGISDFQLGGLYARLMDIGDFAPHKNFAGYVEERFGMKYRKAMYLVEIYHGLINAKVSWDKVKEIGWTKLKALVGILTSENADEWISKALVMNVVSLEQAIKEFKQDGTKPSDDGPKSTMKTMTFKFAEDQQEMVEAAIEKAKSVSGTDVTSAAMEFIAIEYLGTAGNTKKPTGDISELEAQLAAASKALTTANADIAKLTDEVAKASQTEGETKMHTPTPKEFYAYVNEQYDGNLQGAMTYLFGEGSGFEDAFPQIQLDISAKTA